MSFYIWPWHQLVLLGFFWGPGINPSWILWWPVITVILLELSRVMWENHPPLGMTLREICLRKENWFWMWAAQSSLCFLVQMYYDQLPHVLATTARAILAPMPSGYLMLHLLWVKAKPSLISFSQVFCHSRREQLCSLQTSDLVTFTSLYMDTTLTGFWWAEKKCLRANNHLH